MNSKNQVLDLSLIDEVDSDSSNQSVRYISNIANYNQNNLMPNKTRTISQSKSKAVNGNKNMKSDVINLTNSNNSSPLIPLTGVKKSAKPISNIKLDNKLKPNSVSINIIDTSKNDITSSKKRPINTTADSGNKKARIIDYNNSKETQSNDSNEDNENDICKSFGLIPPSTLLPTIKSPLTNNSNEKIDSQSSHESNSRDRKRTTFLTPGKNIPSWQYYQLYEKRFDEIKPQLESHGWKLVKGKSLWNVSIPKADWVWVSPTGLRLCDANQKDLLIEDEHYFTVPKDIISYLKRTSQYETVVNSKFEPTNVININDVSTISDTSSNSITKIDDDSPDDEEILKSHGLSQTSLLISPALNTRSSSRLSNSHPRPDDSTRKNSNEKSSPSLLSVKSLIKLSNHLSSRLNKPPPVLILNQLSDQSKDNENAITTTRPKRVSDTTSESNHMSDELWNDLQSKGWRKRMAEYIWKLPERDWIWLSPNGVDIYDKIVDSNQTHLIDSLIKNKDYFLYPKDVVKYLGTNPSPTSTIEHNTQHSTQTCDTNSQLRRLNDSTSTPNEVDHMSNELWNNLQNVGWRKRKAASIWKLPERDWIWLRPDGVSIYDEIVELNKTDLIGSLVKDQNYFLYPKDLVTYLTLNKIIDKDNRLISNQNQRPLNKSKRPINAVANAFTPTSSLSNSPRSNDLKDKNKKLKAMNSDPSIEKTLSKSNSSSIKSSSKFIDNLTTKSNTSISNTKANEYKLAVACDNASPMKVSIYKNSIFTPPNNENTSIVTQNQIKSNPNQLTLSNSIISVKTGRSSKPIIRMTTPPITSLEKAIETNTPISNVVTQSTKALASTSSTGVQFNSNPQASLQINQNELPDTAVNIVITNKQSPKQIEKPKLDNSQSIISTNLTVTQSDEIFDRNFNNLSTFKISSAINNNNESLVKVSSMDKADNVTNNSVIDTKNNNRKIFHLTPAKWNIMKDFGYMKVSSRLVTSNPVSHWAWLTPVGNKLFYQNVDKLDTLVLNKHYFNNSKDLLDYLIDNNLFDALTKKGNNVIHKLPIDYTHNPVVDNSNLIVNSLSTDKSSMKPIYTDSSLVNDSSNSSTIPIKTVGTVISKPKSNVSRPGKPTLSQTMYRIKRKEIHPPIRYMVDIGEYRVNLINHKANDKSTDPTSKFSEPVSTDSNQIDDIGSFLDNKSEKKSSTIPIDNKVDNSTTNNNTAVNAIVQYQKIIEPPEIKSIFEKKGKNLAMADIWYWLKDCGWSKQQAYGSMTLYSSTYIAPWANERYASEKNLISFLLGRDYFYENEHVVEYVRKFGSNYHNVGISEQLNQLLNSRRISTSRPLPVVLSKHPIQILQQRDQLFEKYKSDGYIFNSSDNIFSDKNVRIFKLTNKPFKTLNTSVENVFTFYDGTCVAYKPETDETPVTYIISFQNSKAFNGSGCIVVDVSEIVRGITDYNNNSSKPNINFKKQKFISNTELTESTTIHNLTNEVNEQKKTIQSLELNYKQQISQLTNDYKQQLILLNQKSSRTDMKLHKTIQSLQNQIIEYKNNYETTKHLNNELVTNHRNEMRKLINESNKNTEKYRKQLLSFEHANRSNNISLTVASNSSIVKSSDDIPNNTSTDLPNKLNIWYEYLTNLLLSRKKAVVLPTSSYLSPVAMYRHIIREDASIIRDGDDYPVQITVDFFSNKDSMFSLLPLLKVTFHHVDIVDSRRVTSSANLNTHYSNGIPISNNSSNSLLDKSSSRRKTIADNAYDAGGLIKQWMNDYFEAIKINVISNVYMITNEPMFTTNNLYYLPNRIDINKYDQSTDSEIKAQHKQVVSFYLTFGKILNYCMRDNISIPRSFASPLVINYLLSDNTDSYVDKFQTYSDICKAIVDYDNGYKSTLQSMSTQWNKNTLYSELLYPYIIEPIESILQIIKRGFNIVPITNHLSIFNWDEFNELFIGDDIYTFIDISNHLDFINEPPIAISYFETFKEQVVQALQHLNNYEIIQFILFTTGSNVIKRQGIDRTIISIYPKLLNSSDISQYPRWPLPKAFTCFSQIFIPFINSPNIWTVNNITSNVRNCLDYIDGEFSDRNIS